MAAIGFVSQLDQEHKSMPKH
jgi:hypothetical protein